MIDNGKIKFVRAYDSTKNTGILDYGQAHVIVEQARSMAQIEGMVAISMKGITSMSPLTAAELCHEITMDNSLANKVAIVGGTPYINQMIGMGMRKASKKFMSHSKNINVIHSKVEIINK